MLLNTGADRAHDPRVTITNDSGLRRIFRPGGVIEPEKAITCLMPEVAERRSALEVEDRRTGVDFGERVMLGGLHETLTIRVDWKSDAKVAHKVDDVPAVTT